MKCIGKMPSPVHESMEEEDGADGCRDRERSSFSILFFGFGVSEPSAAAVNCYVNWARRGPLRASLSSNESAAGAVVLNGRCQPASAVPANLKLDLDARGG